MSLRATQGFRSHNFKHMTTQAAFEEFNQSKREEEDNAQCQRRTIGQYKLAHKTPQS